jgi:aminomethyltransferase
VPYGLTPAGLGARDTLRLEKAYPLYGHELDDATTPLEAGLEWVTKFSKADFLGRDALLRQKKAGLQRKLVGLQMIGPSIARSEYGLFKDGRLLGRVTSGTRSPSLGKSIALGYVAIEECQIDNVVDVEIRGRNFPAQMVSLPFYRH